MMTESADPTSSASSVGMDRLITRSIETWWRRRSLWAAGSAALLAILLWYFLPANGSQDILLAELETDVVAEGNFDDYLPLRANVAPRVVTLVSALTGGQAEMLAAQDGALVAKGQPIAILANPELKLDVLTREAAITSQMSQLTGDELALERSRHDHSSQIAAANYDLLKARRELASKQWLYERGIISEQGLKPYRAEAEYQEGRLASLRTSSSTEEATAIGQAQRLANARAELSGNLAAVHASLDSLTIRAPVTGRLTNFTLQAGQMLKPGDLVGQIDSEGELKLAADVDEFYLGRVSVGQKARAGNATLLVSRVLPSVTNGRFRIELEFVGVAPAGLSRGQTVDTRVTLGAAGRALLAPVGSWLDSGGGKSAFVLDSDGRHARRRPIRLGRRNSDFVEVLSGLRPGERIVTNSSSAAKGEIINIR
jgi:HlyD family secretion protein